MLFENNRGIAANDRTCNKLGRVLQGQARSDLGDGGADCLRYFYGRPRAAPHPSLFRRADRLIRSALVFAKMLYATCKPSCSLTRNEAARVLLNSNRLTLC